MIHYDQGLKITSCRLPLDCTRRQAVSYISHAHRDHMARHQLALCSAETDLLYRFRLGKRRTCILPYRKLYSWGDAELTLYPAGHCLGSSLIKIQYDNESILYTGDFKLHDCGTCQKAELPQAKTLIIESTFASPKFVFPSAENAAQQLIEAVQQGIDQAKIPLVQAYSLGKAQVVTKILSNAGFRVLQTAEMYEISKIYQQCGVDLGRFELLTSDIGDEIVLSDNTVLIAPPQKKLDQISSTKREFWTIATTGWAIEKKYRYRKKVDRAVALSDHADWHQLLETINRVNPEAVYCNHGPKKHVRHFVTTLKEMGITAFPLPAPK